jgi:hypothetical protein
MYRTNRSIRKLVRRTNGPLLWLVEGLVGDLAARGCEVAVVKVAAHDRDENQDPWISAGNYHADILAKASVTLPPCSYGWGEDGLDFGLMTAVVGYGDG